MPWILKDAGATMWHENTHAVVCSIWGGALWCRKFRTEEGLEEIEGYMAVVVALGQCSMVVLNVQNISRNSEHVEPC